MQVLQDLLKSGFTKAEVAAVSNSVGEEPGEAQGDRKRRRRDRSAEIGHQVTLLSSYWSSKSS